MRNFSLKELKEILARKHAGKPVSKDEQKAIERFSAGLREVFAQALTSWERCEEEGHALLNALEGQSLSEIGQYVKENPPSGTAVAFLSYVSQKSDRFRRAAAGARAKSNKYAPAKAVVIESWKKGKETHASKADFARIIVGRIRNECGIEITERTILNWLPK